MNQLAIDNLWAMAKNEGENVVKVSARVLNNPKFGICAGSSEAGAHHGYDGGLAEHTEEVVRLCLQNKLLLKADSVNDAIVFMAALFHDVGKIWDYQKAEDGTWIGTDHKRNIHHISRSGIEWMIASEHIFHNGIRDRVLHCILAHHGLREWGSPVAPKSQEAWLLHICDQLSARMNDWKTNDIVSHKKK